MSDTTRYVVVQEVWVRASADYNASRELRTGVFSPDTTVEDVMRWAQSARVLHAGSITLTREDAPANIRAKAEAEARNA